MKLLQNGIAVLLQVLKTLPKDVHVAVSGGVDSMVALHFLLKKHKVTAVHYVHSDSVTAAEELEFVVTETSNMGVPLLVQHQTTQRDPKMSREAYWRSGRYSWFKTLPGLVVTGHHLDDAVEWYLMTALRGRGEYMEYSHSNVVRPFLGQKKTVILDYAAKYNVNYLHDVSNDDVQFAVRNRVRNNILPEALLVNPGLYNVVRKRISEKTHG